MGALPSLVTRRDWRMKVFSVCTLVALCLALANSLPVENVQSDLASLELVQEDAKSTVDTLKKKGVSDKDCKALAKSMCKEVEDRVQADQKIIDSLDDGSKCLKLGQEAIRKAQAECKKRKTEWTKAKQIVKKVWNAKVKIGEYSFESLNPNKCGFVFSSRSYRTHETLYKRVTKIKATAAGKLKEGRKLIIAAKASAKRQVHMCLCRAQSARDRNWKLLTKSSTRSLQESAHAKCTMMSCVLNGVKLTSSKCKSNLAKLKNKKLIEAAQTDCSSVGPPTDRCKKWSEEKKADTVLSKTLQRKVKFLPNKTTLLPAGKKILDEVANTLKKYPWMSIEIQGHSTVPNSTACTNLTTGRSKVGASYLRTKGCKNKFITKGLCATMIGMKIFANGHSRKPPLGCETWAVVVRV